MTEKNENIDRRGFLRTLGAAGLASVLASGDGIAGPDAATGESQKPKFPQVPRRKLGKTGLKVPCLSLGGNQDLLENQIVLRRAPQWGVVLWDTAPIYRGGNSEIGIGRALARDPKVRKSLLLGSKASEARSVEDVEKLLATSLKSMNTEYIDLYCGVHRLGDPAQLTDELKQWAENAKKRKLIRFLGFSTHANMAQNLAAAAKLDWIDFIVTRYNFRMMEDAAMQDAITACHKAGIGLIAIKTLAFGQRGRRRGPGRPDEVGEDQKLFDHFLKRGFTEAQAKLKCVLQDERFSSVCVGMQNMSQLTANVAAALDKTKLSQVDREVLRRYADATCREYCAGCAHICDAAAPDVPGISDIMRYLMYYDSYGDRAEARRLFAQVPPHVKKRLLGTDYRLAEARCPQHLPIGELVSEAVSKLA